MKYGRGGGFLASDTRGRLRGSVAATPAATMSFNIVPDFAGRGRKLGGRKLGTREFSLLCLKLV